MSVTNIILTGKNICKFLFDVKYGMKTAIAIRGVMLAGSINLLKRIQPSNKLALLKKSFMLLFIGKFMHWIYNMNLLVHHLLVLHRKYVCVFHFFHEQ